MKKFFSTLMVVAVSLLPFSASAYETTINIAKENKDFVASVADDSANPLPAGATFTYTQEYTNNAEPGQCTAGNSATLTISGMDGYSITSMEFYTRSNSKTGTGSLTVTVGTTTIYSITGTYKDAWSNNSAYSTTPEWIKHDMTVANYTVNANENIVITASASVNSVYLQGVKITYVAASQDFVAAPTFSEPSGTYNEAKSVELSCSTEGASIYYTTDGTDPSAASTLYTGAITVSQSMTIKAIAIKDDVSSAIATADYVIVDKSQMAEDAQTFNFTTNGAYGMTPQSGTSGTYETTVKSIPLGDVTLAFTGKYRQWQTSSGYELRVQANATLKISVPEGSFITKIEFAGTTVNKLSVANNNGTYTSSTGVWEGDANSVTFTATDQNKINTITVTYNAPAQAGFVKQPTFGIAGGTFNNDQTVTLSCATEGAAIYYTIDGSEPTAASTAYTAPINVNATMTIKAIAIKDENKSKVVENTYTMVVATPTVSVPAGTIFEAVDVTIATATDDATIYYTLDGNDPTTASSVYTEPINVAATTTIKAIAVKAGYTDSEVITAAYTFRNVTVVNSLAEIAQQTDGDELKINFDLLVAYKNGKYVYLTDGTGYMFVVTSENQDKIKANKYIQAGWIAAWDATNIILNTSETLTVVGESATVITAPAAVDITTTDQLANYINWPVNLDYLNVPNFSGAVYTVTCLTDYSTVNIHNQYSASKPNTGTNSLTGYVGKENDKIVIFPIKYTQISNVNTIGTVTDGECEEVTLNDGQAYVGTVRVEALEIGYYRTFSNIETWKPWYAPFEIEASEFVDVIQLTAATGAYGDITLDFTTVTGTLNANTPYLVKVKNAGEDVFGVECTYLEPAESNSVEFNGFSLTGVYLTKEDMEGIFAIASDGNFHPGSASATLKPFRFFLTVPAGMQTAPVRMRINGVDDATGIDTLEIDTLVAGKIYNMQGVRVDNPTSGVYIIDGKKVYIK